MVLKQFVDDAKFLPLSVGQQMGIAERHFDALVAHKRHEFVQRDLAGLCEPAGKRVAQCMESDLVPLEFSGGISIAGNIGAVWSRPGRLTISR